MKAWRLDDEKLRAIGREAHAKIQQMSPAATLRDLERFYTRVMNKPQNVGWPVNVGLQSNVLYRNHSNTQ